ncbi:EcoRI family type II restriction endonuclease [Helicobacter heilmannii]|uniref:EcoRI family type II restriction endonuclease n=1 Tax=Helicobacter heilmannii TaxID=35817 RepID=UPI0006B3BDD0|nr:EcoRI family type II restriction endonuclease [Helicobacter heilmannii]
MEGKRQSDRLTAQQKASEGVLGIFDEGAQNHDKKVADNAKQAMRKLEAEYPMFTFRYRKELSKKEINESLQKINRELGQTLFVQSAKIIPDGGLIEVRDDYGIWRVVVVSEAKFQGKDIENIKAGVKVGKHSNQDLMVAGNAIERAHKNIKELANFMLFESHFPYILFLEGSNFLTHNIEVQRPNGETYELHYDNGALNRLDRLTAANYGMKINTNLCKNRFIFCNNQTIMLQAVSIYTQGDGEHWRDNEMVAIMLDIAKTSLQMLGKDLFKQLTYKNQ